MDILNVAYYTALRNLKDLRMLAMLILAPIVLILILGSALDGFMQPREIEQVSVAYLSEDSGAVGQGLTAFLESQEVKPYISLVSVANLTEGEELLANGKISAFVYVPPGLSQALLRGEKAHVQVQSPSKTPLVMAFVQNYTNTLSSTQAVMSIGGDATFSQRDFVDKTSVETTGKVPRAIDYYSVQTLLQFMMMGAWYGVGGVQDDRDMNTVVRIKLSSVKQSSVFLGKLLANIFVLFLQTSVVVLFTKFVYGANWGGSPWVIGATLLLFATLSIGLGMLIGTSIRDGSKAFGVLWICMFFFSVVAGAFGKVQPGSILESLARVSPNHYAGKAIFGTVFGGSTDIISSSLLVLLVAALITLSLAMVMERRKA